MQLEEIYDVVDSKGSKIGEATWTEVHSKGLLHQSVHGIVVNSNKTRTLIKKRTKTMHQEPGKYEIAVAGHILSGEEPKEAIIRELSEELFSKSKLPNEVSIMQLTSYFHNDLPNNNEIAHLFVIIHDGPFSIQKEEASDSEWISFEKLKEDIKYDPSKYARYSIDAFRNYAKLSKTSL